jgi:serine protease AprX
MFKQVLKLISIICLALLAPAFPSAQDPGEKVLIRIQKPYASTVAAIEAQGGKVTHQFKYIDAIAAEVPRAALPAIRALVGASAISKDEEIRVEPPVDTNAIRGGPVPLSDAQDETFESAEPLTSDSLATVNPAAYQVNNGVANLNALHGAGFVGTGVIVAVIDTGIRPGFPHLSLDGSVIGCDDFVGDALGCSNSGNHFHGTFVAGLVSANVIFGFSPASALRNAILAECPACFVNAPTNTLVPMVGTAPLSSIYALRVLDANGSGSNARVIAGIERAIELRQLFEAGNPAGKKIQVANLSLGGPALFPGRDLLDLIVNQLIENDIVPVIAAGNTGPSSLTTGSPGSATSVITVGAASLARNERILRRVQFGPAVGSLYRPFLGTQTATFSSRGPNADGRPDPDVVANGFASFGQGNGAINSITIASGTSAASPSVAGVAAVLRQRFPTATARQIRNAIIASANPTLLADGSTELDQGAGYVDAGAAAALLATGTVPDALPALNNFNKSVKVNVEKNTDLDVRDGLVSETIGALKPGERFDIVYRVHPNTSQVAVAIGVTPALPPSQQNQLFGDDVLLTVHTAKTSAIGVGGDYRVFAFVLAGGTFVINNPEPGLMRITVNGDWTNAGNVGASVNVFSLSESTPGVTRSGTLVDGQTLVFPVNIPAGTKLADFRLEWREDWGNYPTNDIDLILVRPNNTLVFDGATLNNPEVAAVKDPLAGTWLAVVDGFEVASGDDKFKLRVALDGKVLK